MGGLILRNFHVGGESRTAELGERNPDDFVGSRAESLGNFLSCIHLMPVPLAIVDRKRMRLETFAQGDGK